MASSPALRLPPPELRDLRALIAYRRRLLERRSAARAALHDLLRRYRLTPPGADRLAADRPEWWATRALAPEDGLRAQSSLEDLGRVTTHLAEAEADLEAYAAEGPWRAQAAALLGIPGVRRLDAIILLAEIGAAARFPTAGHLAAYAGLVGNPALALRGGGREIHATMLEIARAAVREDAAWASAFAALEQRIGRERASVAIARKLVALVWEILIDSAEQQQVRQAAA